MLATPLHAVSRRRTLAPLGSDGAAVDVSLCVEPRTSFAVGVIGTAMVVGLVLLTLTIWGIVLAAVAQLLRVVVARRLRATLRGSALRVGPGQFPEIHACVETYSRRLGLGAAPEVFVVDESSVNAFALRVAGENAIVLTDETVAACLEGDSPGALTFVLGHELGHVALGHTSWWRRQLSLVRWLSRLDEHSADNVACDLVGNREHAEDGILLLAAGPRLLPFVDREAALAQAREATTDARCKRAERHLTHPLTLRRLERVSQRSAARPRVRRAA